MLDLSICVKPPNNVLGQPLQMAARGLDWGDSLNQCCKGGERLTVVMLFVGEYVSVLDGILVLFLLYKTYRVGVFHSPPNPLSGLSC